MPRYYFQLLSNLAEASDEGLELPDLASAHRHALAALGAVITEELANDNKSITLCVNIASASGERVAWLKVEAHIVSSHAPFEDQASLW